MSWGKALAITEKIASHARSVQTMLDESRVEESRNTTRHLHYRGKRSQLQSSCSAPESRFIRDRCVKGRGSRSMRNTGVGGWCFREFLSLASRVTRVVGSADYIVPKTGPALQRVRGCNESVWSIFLRVDTSERPRFEGKRQRCISHDSSAHLCSSSLASSAKVISAVIPQ